MLWKDLRTELHGIFEETALPRGWTSVYDVEYITLLIELVRDGNATPLITTEKDRAAVITD